MNEDDKKRTNIEDIPRAEEELSDDEAKGVQGGLINQKGAIMSLGGPSVSPSSDSAAAGSGRIGSIAVDPSDPTGNT